MNRILLVRHGDAAGEDSSDPALSGTGVAQLRAMAERLRAQPVQSFLDGSRRRPSGERASHSMSDVGHLAGLRGASS